MIDITLEQLDKANEQLKDTDWSFNDDYNLCIGNWTSWDVFLGWKDGEYIVYEETDSDIQWNGMKLHWVGKNLLDFYNDNKPYWKI